MNERDLFIAALQQEAQVDRRAYLDEACKGNNALRQGVEALLEMHERAGSFLDSPVVGLIDSFHVPIKEQPGTLIGPYKLLEQIGEGGFGIVFLAEQQHPVRRKVALKVIKPGMDTKQVIARFEAERQALAMMDHTNIARVLDAGTTEAGRPYFAMELVRGMSITQFGDDNRLMPRERLELFLAVCQAVQHAHQKGIIHRDLKPSNVLVTLHDGTPVVKVIDFGIAKALGQERLTEKTLFTSLAHMVGTPLYMSPEQAAMNGQDVDTRSDIYALGVLLYELLTGTTPFDKECLKQASDEEIRRIIREEEPAKPSTRVSTLGQADTTVSANRQSEPKRLSQLFRGELDWIVMKALEKDRNRRYDTASSFAADVQRYLHDEPVQACPPSAIYRFGKFARRHKAALTAALVLAFSVLLAVVGLATSTVLIGQEKQATENALRAETRAKEELEQQRDVAQANHRRAEQILDTAYRSFERTYLAWAEERLPQAQEITPKDRQFLEDALTFYVEFAHQNSSEPIGRRKAAEAYFRVAIIQSELGHDVEAKGNYTQALEAFRRLAAEFPNEADYRCSTARCLTEMVGGLHKPFFDSTEEILEALHQAIKLQERLVAEYPTRADYQGDLVNSCSRLGMYLFFGRQYDEVEKVCRPARTLGARLVAANPTVMSYRQDLCDVLSWLGYAFLNTGRLREVEQVFHERLDRSKQLVTDFPGRSYPLFSLMWGYQNLACLQWRTQRLEDAIENLRQSVHVGAKLAADFPGVREHRELVADVYGDLAFLRSQMRRVQEAEQAYRDALALWEVLARDDPTRLEWTVQLGRTQCELAHSIRERGQPETSLAWYDQAIATLDNVYAKKTPPGARDLLRSARRPSRRVDRAAAAHGGETSLPRIGTELSRGPRRRTSQSRALVSDRAALPATGRPKGVPQGLPGNAGAVPRHRRSAHRESDRHHMPPCRGGGRRPPAGPAARRTSDDRQRAEFL